MSKIQGNYIKMYFFCFCNTCLKSTWWNQFVQLLLDSHKAWPLLSPLFPHIKPSNKPLLPSYQASKTVLNLGNPYFFSYNSVICVHNVPGVSLFFLRSIPYFSFTSKIKAISLNFQVDLGSDVPKHWSTQESQFLKKKILHSLGSLTKCHSSISQS